MTMPAKPPAKQIVPAPEGRRMLQEAGKPSRVALPMHCIAAACTPQEKAVLMRFTEAAEMAAGNMAVVLLNGIPRGRFAEYARPGLDALDYANFEIEAYRWIERQAFGKSLATSAEILARMNGERIGVVFEEWGAHLANSRDDKIALGAAIGAARAIAWALMDAYRDYYEFWRVREEVARHGRALTEAEGVRRLRKDRNVRNAALAHRPQDDDAGR